MTPENDAPEQEPLRKGSRQKRPVYDVYRKTTLATPPDDDPAGQPFEAIVLLAAKVSTPSRGKAVDQERAKLPKEAQFGTFFTVRHGEMVEEERVDPHAALVDDLVARMREVAPDAAPEWIREQARLAVEQNGGTS